MRKYIPLTLVFISLLFLFSLSVQAQESGLVQIKNLSTAYDIEYELARKAVFDVGVGIKSDAVRIRGIQHGRESKTLPIDLFKM